MRTKLINSPVMYAFGMLAMMIPSTAFGSFYSYFYVEKLGLGLGLATLARTIFLIWDAVNQPLVGYLSDRTKSRFGRRRPWIVGTMPLFMLMFILIYTVPHGLEGYGLFAWFMAALILYEAAATVLWVNYGALFPELFKGDVIRARASAVQQGFQIIALLIGTALTPILYAWLGFSGMSIVFAAAFALFMLICVKYVREDPDASREMPTGLADAFRTTLRNHAFWIFNLANSFAQTVNGLLSSIIPFYAKYVLHIPESQVSILLASIFVSVIPLVGVWYVILRRIDPVKGWRLSLLAYGLSVIPLWFGNSLLSGIMAGVMVGFGLAGFLVSPPIVSGMIIDRDYAESGLRREGVYTAVSGFITRSSGLISSLAFLLVGLAFGYKSGNEPGPNPEATFRYLISVVPLGLLMISFLLSWFVRIGGGKRSEA
ncbi:MFS transporter [Paenibacillus sp. R14(2021)]|uniref:MFS transporter n=1 Tax=Paenibacillus sp. R14(2021) TaxID=2859228 RepID=UPI001C614BD6|nr:MFS transporter [Paenibacillus sp. R14(2021)]